MIDVFFIIFLFCAFFLISRAIKANIYLAYVFFVSAFSYSVFIYTDQLQGDYINTLYLIVVWIFNALLSIHLIRLFVSKISRCLNFVQSGALDSKIEIRIFALVLVTIYIVMTPALLRSPWWLDDIFRSAYMSENSIFLRGIKFTPIFIAAYLFSSKVLNRTIMLKLLMLSCLFSIYMGSKSGMIFLIATLSIYASVYKIKLISFLRFYLMPAVIFLLFIAYYFSVIASNSGNAVIEELSIRFGSDFIGLVRIFDLSYLRQCSNTSYIAPIISTLSKVFTFIDSPTGHLSYGNCLANPADTDYPFELLVPLYFELYGIYGSELSILFAAAILVVVYLQFKVLGWLGILLKIRLTAVSAQIYFSYTILSVIWGGKFFNYLMSDYLSVLALMVLVGFTKGIILNMNTSGLKMPRDSNNLPVSAEIRNLI